MIEALLFDFDGLILDTETPAYQSWQSIFQSYGLELPLNQWAQCIGTRGSSFHPLSYLKAKLFSPDLLNQIYETYQKKYQRQLQKEEIRPGILNYFHEAKKLGLRLAVVSSSNQDWVLSHLSRFQLADYFDSIRCFEDVNQVKPHPELYWLTLETLGIEAHQAIAFEDSPNGIAAAKAASIYCIAIPNDITRQLSLDQADLQLDSLPKMPLRELLYEIQKC